MNEVENMMNYSDSLCDIGDCAMSETLRPLQDDITNTWLGSMIVTNLYEGDLDSAYTQIVLEPMSYELKTKLDTYITSVNL
jgi:hypothetical protein